MCLCVCVFTYIRPCECHSVSKHQAKSWNDETKKLVYRRFETINQCAQTHLTASFPLAMHRQMMSATSCSSSWRCWRQRRNPPKFLFSCMEGQHSKQFENHPRDSKSHQNHAPKKTQTLQSRKAKAAKTFHGLECTRCKICKASWNRLVTESVENPIARQHTGPIFWHLRCAYLIYLETCLSGRI